VCLRDQNLVIRSLDALSQNQINTLTVVPLGKVVKDVIAELKKIASSQENQDALHAKMLKTQKSLESEHEGFMDLFVEQHGIYHL